MDEANRNGFSPTPGMDRAAFSDYESAGRICPKCGLAVPKYVGRYPERCPRCSEQGVTHGMARKAFGPVGAARECEECGLGIPKYAGRYPERCPRCSGAVVMVSEERAERSGAVAASNPKRRRKRKVVEVRHAVAAGFKPQSPKLQELLDHAWPALTEAVEERQPDPASVADFAQAAAMLDGRLPLDEEVLYEIIGRLIKAVKGWRKRRKIKAVQKKRKRRAIDRAIRKSGPGVSQAQAGRNFHRASKVGTGKGKAFGGKGKKESFKPQSPKLQALLDDAWPATMAEGGDSTPIHLVPYGAFDVDDILPLLEGPVSGVYYRIEQPDEPVMLFAFDESKLACWASDEPERFIGFDPRDQIVYEDWHDTFEITERKTLSGEESKSTGKKGREFEDAFIKALHILGLQFEENRKKPPEDPQKDVGDWSGPVWDIKPRGPGWYNLISGRGTNLKITTARHAWTAGGADLYKKISGYIRGADNGQWSQATAEKRIMAATEQMLKATGAHRTVWMKPKNLKVQNAIIKAVRGRGDKEKLRALMVKENFASKLLGDSYKLSMKMDWDKQHAEDLIEQGWTAKEAVTAENSWQGGFNLYLDGGVDGKLGLTARIDYKGGIYTVAWRDRQKTPAKKEHPVRVQESDAEIRHLERLAAAGDYEAQTRLRAALVRAGLLTPQLRAAYDAIDAVNRDPHNIDKWEVLYHAARRAGRSVRFRQGNEERYIVIVDAHHNRLHADYPEGHPLSKPVTEYVRFAHARVGGRWQDYQYGISTTTLGMGRVKLYLGAGGGGARPPRRLTEDVRAAVGRPRKPGQGLTRVYGGFRFQVGKNQDRKPRKDIGLAIQNRLNARRGLGKRVKKAKEWHRSHKGAEMHSALSRYNKDNNRSKMRETIADVRERIARWTAQYQEKGYVGIEETNRIEETNIGANRYLSGYASAPDNKTLDDTFEALLRRLIVMEALDVLQDVEFDDDNGSLYLFFDPSLPNEEMDEVVRSLKAEEPSLALIASPDRSLEGEMVDSEWWVVFLPGKGEDGQPSVPDSRVYAAVPEPGSKVQMVTMAPPTPVEQIALDVDVGKLLKSMGGK